MLYISGLYATMIRRLFVTKRTVRRRYQFVAVMNFFIKIKYIHHDIFAVKHIKTPREKYAAYSSKLNSLSTQLSHPSKSFSLTSTVLITIKNMVKAGFA